jgi:hypothetical protein
VKGDELCNKLTNNIRILLNNINSLRPKNREKWKAIIKEIQEFEADITCLNETCVNFRRNNLRRIYRRLLQLECPDATMAVTTTPQNYTKRYLPGGTTTISMGRMSKQVRHHIYDSKNLGRWCGTTYNLGNNKKLHVVSAYRVCQQAVNRTNSMSTYTQQHFMMKKRGIDNPNPREQFIVDFVSQFKDMCKNKNEFFMV